MSGEKIKQVKGDLRMLSRGTRKKQVSILNTVVRVVDITEVIVSTRK